MFRAAIYSLLVSAAAAWAFAESGANDRLDDEIRALESELSHLSERRESFLARLEQLQKMQSLLAERAALLNAERAETVRARDASRARLKDIAVERAELEVRLEAALAALYRMGPPRTAAWLAAGENPARAMRGYRYVSHMGRAETAAAERLDALRRETAEREASLDAALVRMKTLERQIEEERRAATRARGETEGHLNSLAGDTELRKTALGELERARAALAMFFGGVSRDVVTGLLDMEAFKGLLPPPVEAETALGFGPVAHPRFKTRVPHNGLSFDVPAGTSVRAVFDGSVVFSGWFEGYGQTLIMEHGGGYFTVYAHNGSLRKSAGETAAKGEVVALSGDTGSLRGPTLYFELRKESQPLDPAPWLRRSGTAR